MRQRRGDASTWQELTHNPSLNPEPEPEPSPNPNPNPDPDQVHHKMTRSTRSRLLWSVPRASMPPCRARQRICRRSPRTPPPPPRTHAHICICICTPPALLRPPPLRRFTVAEAVVLVRPRCLSPASAITTPSRPCSPASPRLASPRPAPPRLAPPRLALPRLALSRSLWRSPTWALRCTVQVAVSLWQILYLKSFFEIKRVV